MSGTLESTVRTWGSGSRRHTDFSSPLSLARRWHFGNEFQSRVEWSESEELSSFATLLRLKNLLTIFAIGYLDESLPALQAQRVWHIDICAAQRFDCGILVVEIFNIGEKAMATVNFSIPDDLKEAFNEAFQGENKSAIVARLMRQALEEKKRQLRRSEAIEAILDLRRTQAPAADEEIGRARRDLRR